MLLCQVLLASVNVPQCLFNHVSRRNIDGILWEDNVFQFPPSSCNLGSGKGMFIVWHRHAGTIWWSINSFSSRDFFIGVFLKFRWIAPFWCHKRVVIGEQKNLIVPTFFWKTNFPILLFQIQSSLERVNFHFFFGGLVMSRIPHLAWTSLPLYGPHSSSSLPLEAVRAHHLQGCASQESYQRRTVNKNELGVSQM